MISHSEFNMILECLQKTSSMCDLGLILTDFCHRIGFEQYAMGHHVDLLHPPKDAIRLTNYHADWIDQTLENRFFHDDPVHAAYSRLSRPFIWSEIENHIVLTDHHRMILENARHYGLIEGFTIPVRMIGEYEGTFSLAARSLDRLPPFALPMAQMAASNAFETARRILRKSSGQIPRSIPHLTIKQKQSLVLVGRGKTDAEIGAVLGISRTTAHDHVEAGRRAYGNAQRPFLVLRALYDGVISFADVFRD